MLNAAGIFLFFAINNYAAIDCPEFTTDSLKKALHQKGKFADNDARFMIVKIGEHDWVLKTKEFTKLMSPRELREITLEQVKLDASGAPHTCAYVYVWSGDHKAERNTFMLYQKIPVFN